MELFKLLGTIAIDNSGADSAIEGTASIAESAKGKISNAFNKIGSVAAKVGKTVAVGMGAAATAIGAVAKKALDSYADYEQLVGGVETLFGAGGLSIEEYAKSVGKSVDAVKDEYASLMTAQETVMKDASEAYKTAGLSANEYMETVTGFSASLIQSLGGDTEMAAKVANRAITDMSDNANKMGSDMSSIQNAYAGFAKQNYTMLDNLKLGYGGTNEEMARLIADAAKMTDIQEELGITVDASSDSFANIVNAISVMQKKMGITGTTAKEASKTISGSISAMKSAWTNLITGLGDEDADLDGLIYKFVDSFITATDNVIPRIEKILQGIAKAIRKFVPKISQKLPSLISSLLPGLIEGAVALLNGLLDALPTLLDIILEEIPYILKQVGTALLEAAPKLFQSVKKLIGKLWNFVSLEILNSGVSFDDAIDSVLNSSAFGTMKKTFASIKETIKPLIESFKNLGGAMFDSAKESTFLQDALGSLANAFNAYWTYIGQPIIEKITDAINWLADNWATITEKCASTFQYLWGVVQVVWVNTGKPVFDMIVSSVKWIIGMFQEYMPDIKEFFQKTVAGMKDSWENHLKPMFEEIGILLNEVVKPAFEFTFKTIKPLVETVFQSISRLWHGTLKPVFDGIIDFLTGAFTNDWKKAFQGILNIITGVYNSMIEPLRVPFDAIKNIINNTIDYIQEKFKFKWELPKIKLPHFTIEGSFSLNPPSVPKLGIDWYAKAMDNPMIMNEPTAFGINSRGQIMAGGEAGSEVVSGTNTLMNMISDAVAAQNMALVAYLQKLIQMLADYFPQILESMDRDFVFNDGTMAAYLAPAMDEELGRLKGRKDRGR